MMDIRIFAYESTYYSKTKLITEQQFPALYLIFHVLTNNIPNYMATFKITHNSSTRNVVFTAYVAYCMDWQSVK